jgi:hypothetical protein
MFPKIRNGIIGSALALVLTVFSATASAASGPVTYLFYYANYYTLLVTAGGVSCGYTTNNIEPAKIAGAIAMLASAKANRTNVSLYCPVNSGMLQISMD